MKEGLAQRDEKLNLQDWHSLAELAGLILQGSVGLQISNIPVLRTCFQTPAGENTRNCIGGSRVVADAAVVDQVAERAQKVINYLLRMPIGSR